MGYVRITWFTSHNDTQTRPSPPLKSSHIGIKDAQCYKINEKIIFDLCNFYFCES